MCRVVYRRSVCGAAANSVAVPVGAFVYGDCQTQVSEKSPPKTVQEPGPISALLLIFEEKQRRKTIEFILNLETRLRPTCARSGSSLRLFSVRSLDQGVVYSHSSHKIQVVFFSL